MSALVEIMLKNGFTVTGSDATLTALTDKLSAKGAKIYKGHAEQNILGADLVVNTAAVKADNPEMQAAKAQNIPVIERAVLLGEMMKKYKNAVAISGTHGKTTTTGMVSEVFLQADLDPTILIGGELDSIGGNVRIGDQQYFVTEACEYVDSFLQFHPTHGIILNIEADHLDYFKDLNHIVHSFHRFASIIPLNGALIVNGDDAAALKASEGLSCPVLTFGIDNQEVDFSAKKIRYTDGLASYDLKLPDGTRLPITLSVVGRHNILNSAAVVALALQLGIPTETIQVGLKNFGGTHRRFEHLGKVNGFTLVDDYAHHPTEITATLTAAANMPHRKLWCIFQSHTYTRTAALLDAFASSLKAADHVIIADIYAAREIDHGVVHGRDLVNRILALGGQATYLGEFVSIAQYILQHAQPDDLVITMGAGNIDEVAKLLLAQRSV
ncbi:MAG: UDP-N-acetylmuramate--L-alanine ligase [Hyphomonadaceae bacterium]|nr:UDP-N-acetylmuramate--L-alanine ligase [Clostridia bacterium]